MQQIKLEVATAHARSVLHIHGVAYQKQIALQAISDGKLELPVIEQWVSEQMKAVADAAVQASATAVTAAGICTLICNQSAVVPKHLEVHSDELQNWRARLATMAQRQVLSISLKSVTQQLPENTVAPMLAAQHLEPTACSSMAALTAVMDELTVLPTADQLKYLRRMAANSVQSDDAVYMLILRRLVGAVSRSILQQQPLTDAWLGSQGLLFTAESIRQLCKEVLKLVQHHGNIFGSLYSQLIAEIQ